MSEEKEEKPLKPEHRIFAENYVLEWNGTQSYIAAYPNVNENTAAVNATKLLRNTKILAYIEEIQKDLSKLCGVSAARNVNELKKIAYSNMSKYKDNWMTEIEFNKLSEDDKAALSEIQYTTRHTEYGEEKIVKFKLHDKHRALEIMNKMLGYNSPEKVDIALQMQRKESGQLFPDTEKIKGDS